MNNPVSSERLDVLHVRNFPASFAPADVERLLKYFGARRVTIRPGSDRKPGNKRLEARAEFGSRQEAMVTLLRIHQQMIDGRRLRAVFATEGDYYRCDENESYPKDENEKTPSVSKPPPDEVSGPNRCNVFSFPPPTKTVLMRVANAMANNLGFYSEVLELMSKHNLPPPFTPGVSMYEIGPFDIYREDIPSERKHTPQDMELSSSSEEDSELEDEPGSAYAKEIVPEAKTKQPKKKETKERAKKLLQSAKLPTTTKTKKVTEFSQAFEQTEEVKKARMEISAPASIQVQAQLDLASSEEVGAGTEGGFGVFGSKEGAAAGSDAKRESGETGEFFSREFMFQNRVSEKDYELLPPFKNYSPGEPTARLYVKNLAKSTDEDDLRKVYGGYVDWGDPEEVEKFDLKVLKEGRMKGQAFVSLPNIEKAQLARKETNGFILKEKPMVVSFARSAGGK